MEELITLPPACPPPHTIGWDCPFDKQLPGGTGRAATDVARVGAGATNSSRCRHLASAECPNVAEPMAGISNWRTSLAL